MSQISANLDDLKLYEQLDPKGMLTCLREMPQQCEQAWRMALKFELPSDYSKVNKVVILGMGGSAIGGDLVSSLVISEARLPVLVCRGYSLPAYVDAETLVIASSYSGNTEEILSAFEQALTTDAKKLVLTTGGRLQTMAERGRIPVFSFSYAAQPRAALPFSFLPLIAFLQRLGFLRDKSRDVAEMVRTLGQVSQAISERVPLSANPAKQLAQRLHGHLPVIYGAEMLSEVAHRWKTQINENGKAWAFYEVFPELNHNAVVGYQLPAELASKMLVVLLRSSLLTPRIQLRYQITCQLLEQAKIAYEFMEAEGDNQLSQMMSLVLFGDYVSCYLAILYGVDPSPVKAIDYLKGQLARHVDK